MSLLQAFKGHRGEYLVALQFVLFFAFIIAPNWNPLATPAVLAALEPVRWAALGALGLVSIAFGAFGMLHIRDYLTPLPYPVDHSQLVKHGVYAWVRHPLYSSQLLAALGWTLYSLSLPHLMILIIGFIFFDYKARKEEAWLTERHPEYADYARSVHKFVPWIY
ncbi:Protein-S-isoprenylcysteine O-methyltransferase Ste14 [Allochromatium warmingii]|uniref:Protein-S-isoprenylcysteine O-methyltransferase Ste14 n=1 Tax=Allochromatium warmingii TaxID=61595 RepID=A0A1H3FX41_ALLWA|nr:isoprenylcysteine carboxylmethyltransferase family protein [Allochromatium warmingii]SDX95347.1 Protein-S-isoprenylcysteine O-methyltransferase Ste14 [Allochromatium warmingii]